MLWNFLGFQKPEEIDSKLMLPVFDILFPFLPEKLLSKLRFGVRYDAESLGVISPNSCCIFVGCCFFSSFRLQEKRKNSNRQTMKQ